MEFVEQNLGHRQANPSDGWSTLFVQWCENKVYLEAPVTMTVGLLEAMILVMI